MQFRDQVSINWRRPTMLIITVIHQLSVARNHSNRQISISHLGLYNAPFRDDDLVEISEHVFCVLNYSWHSVRMSYWNKMLLLTYLYSTALVIIWERFRFLYIFVEIHGGGVVERLVRPVLQRWFVHRVERMLTCCHWSCRLLLNVCCELVSVSRVADAADYWCKL